jgi:glycosyltransferase involved in cell wall biosynthesis
MTFHSCTLLPGATPFVRTAQDQQAFLRRVDRFLAHCAEEGFAFQTLGEVGRTVLNGREAKPDRSSKRRALLVSYYFPPAKAVGAQRPARLARLLPELGFDVDVVCAGVTDTAPPPRAGDFLPEACRPRRVSERFVLGRDPDRPPGREEPVARLWWKARAYLEWILLTRDWSWQWAHAALRATSDDLDRAGYDVVIVDAPPRPGVVPFMRWARRKGIPTVLDLRDVWALENERLPIWAPLAPRLRREWWDLRLRDEAIRSAERIVLTSPEMADLMASRVPDVERSRFVSIPNAFGEVDQAAPGQIGKGSAADPFTIVYTGSLAYGRDEQAMDLLRAMAILERSGGPTIQLVLAGGNAQTLTQVAENEGMAGRLVTHSWLSREQSLELQRSASALLLLQPDEHTGTRVAIPAKLFEYMARRRAILGLVGGPAARVIQEHGLGVVARSDDPAGLADAIVDLVECVKREPFLRPPPDGFSETTTTADFAALLSDVLSVRS